MLGLILSRLRQQNSNWNAPSVKQLLVVLFGLHLKKTNSITIMLIIITVCLRTQKERAWTDIWHLLVYTDVTNTHTHTHTTKNINTLWLQQSLCVLVCAMRTTTSMCVCARSHGGAFIAPFPCCDDSPVSHRPESEVAQVRNPSLSLRWSSRCSGRSVA